MLNEPPPSPADVHFRVAGIPVRVHPFFWLIAIFLGLRFFDGEPRGTILGVCVVFLSILVHELGHAVTQMRFGGHPRIVLHGIGGLAICGDCDRSPKSQIIISLAGPLAGFLLAILTFGFVALTSDYAAFQPFWMSEESISRPDPDVIERVKGVGLLFGTFWFAIFPASGINDVVLMLLVVNIFWGILNLLPVYPLDGGQVSRELFLLGSYQEQGIIRSLQLSIGVAIAAIIYGLSQADFFLVILFGFLGYSNYRTYQAYTGRGPGMGWQ